VVCGIEGSGSTQVQRPVDQRVTMRATKGEKHPDLRDLDTPGSGEVLTLYASRRAALGS
jgi:hypothetical protein